MGLGWVKDEWGAARKGLRWFDYWRDENKLKQKKADTGIHLLATFDRNSSPVTPPESISSKMVATF